MGRRAETEPAAAPALPLDLQWTWLGRFALAVHPAYPGEDLRERTHRRAGAMRAAGADLAECLAGVEGGPRRGRAARGRGARSSTPIRAIAGEGRNEVLARALAPRTCRPRARRWGGVPLAPRRVARGDQHPRGGSHTRLVTRGGCPANTGLCARPEFLRDLGQCKRGSLFGRIAQHGFRERSNQGCANPRCVRGATHPSSSIRSPAHPGLPRRGPATPTPCVALRERSRTVERHSRRYAPHPATRNGSRGRRRG